MILRTNSNSYYAVRDEYCKLALRVPGDATVVQHNGQLTHLPVEPTKLKSRLVALTTLTIKQTKINNIFLPLTYNICVIMTWKLLFLKETKNFLKKTSKSSESKAMINC